MDDAIIRITTVVATAAGAIALALVLDGRIARSWAKGARSATAIALAALTIAGIAALGQAVKGDLAERDRKIAVLCGETTSTRPATNAICGIVVKADRP